MTTVSCHSPRSTVTLAGPRFRGWAPDLVHAAVLAAARRAGIDAHAIGDPERPDAGPAPDPPGVRLVGGLHDDAGLAPAVARWLRGGDAGRRPGRDLAWTAEPAPASTVTGVFGQLAAAGLPVTPPGEWAPYLQGELAPALAPVAGVPAWSLTPGEDRAALLADELTWLARHLAPGTEVELVGLDPHVAVRLPSATGLRLGTAVPVEPGGTPPEIPGLAWLDLVAPLQALDRDGLDRLVGAAADQRRDRDLRLRLTGQPGPGWHRLRRRLEAAGLTDDGRGERLVLPGPAAGRLGAGAGAGTGVGVGAGVGVGVGVGVAELRTAELVAAAVGARLAAAPADRDRLDHLLLGRPLGQADLSAADRLSAPTTTIVGEGLQAPVPAIGRPCPTEGSLASRAPGFVTVDDRMDVELLPYAEAAGTEILLPTVLTISGPADLDRFLADADTARHDGVFGGPLSHPLTLLADACAWAGPGSCAGLAGHRLVLGPGDGLAVGPRARPVARWGDTAAAVRRRIARHHAGQERSRGCATCPARAWCSRDTCLEATVDAAAYCAARRTRPWLWEYVVAARAGAVVAAGASRDEETGGGPAGADAGAAGPAATAPDAGPTWRASGFGGHLFVRHSTPAADHPRPFVLLRHEATGHHYVAPTSGDVVARVSVPLAACAELLAVAGGAREAGAALARSRGLDEAGAAALVERTSAALARLGVRGGDPAREAAPAPAAPVRGGP